MTSFSNRRRAGGITAALLLAVTGLPLAAGAQDAAPAAETEGAETQGAGSAATPDFPAGRIPATEAPAAAMGDGEPMDAGTPAAPPDAAGDAAEGQKAGLAFEGQILAPGAGAMRVTELIGAPVAARDGARVGHVADLILDPGERIGGLVVAVGGFMGIGEKLVGVDMERASRIRAGSGEQVVVLDLEPEALERAAAFGASGQAPGGAD